MFFLVTSQWDILQINSGAEKWEVEHKLKKKSLDSTKPRVTSLKIYLNHKS